MTFRICPDCGGRLDPGEKCNCREEEKALHKPTKASRATNT